jgi:hypothetical protein
LLRTCLTLGLALTSIAALAEEEAQPQIEPIVVAYAGRVVPPMTAPDPMSTSQADPAHRQWDRALPFFAQRVIDKGYDLPNPYDIGVSLYMGDQKLHLSDLAVGFNGAPRSAIDFVEFTRSDIHTRSYQVQVGGWLFPFLNVYGIAGQVHGYGDIDISIPGAQLMDYLNVSGCNRSGPLRPDLCDRTLSGTAKPNYRGNSIGVGMTVAGAWKQLFFAVPITYVVTDVSISDSPSRALNIAPRVGWTQHLKEYGALVYYVGGTYLRSTTDLVGEFEFDTANTAIGRNTSLSFDIHERQVSSWNYLVGANWNISKRWGVAAEIGFGNTRQDLIVTGFFRF